MTFCVCTVSAVFIAGRNGLDAQSTLRFAALGAWRNVRNGPNARLKPIRDRGQVGAGRKNLVLAVDSYLSPTNFSSSEILARLAWKSDR
jgi:hypothetical protein